MFIGIYPNLLTKTDFAAAWSAALKQLHMETVYIHVCTVDGGLKLRADEIICVERRKNKGSFAKKAEAFTRFMKMRKENFM